MIANKIDNLLFEKVFSLGVEKKWQCIVYSNDFLRTKKILLHNNIEIVCEYLFINAFCVIATKKQICYLSRISQVRFISSLSKVSALMNVAQNVLATKKSELCGRGRVVAFIDTGIKMHGDFCLGKSRVKLFKDFILAKKHAYDDNGHGTFVAGVCCGNGALSGGKYMGIAPQSEMIVCKALDENGQAGADKILDAMQWVYDNHKKEKIDVVCMSFGSEPLGFNDPIMRGAETLWNDGVVVVAAAGNSGPEYQTIKSPGISRKIITVGGFDDNRSEERFEKNFFEVAPFSSRGPAFKNYKPDLVAPAVDIVSCDRNEFYCTLSGTSVACPMVAGMCLLIKEMKEDLSPDQIKKVLLSACRPICFNRNIEGYGYPDFSKINLN